MGVLVLHPRVYQREETQTALCVCELHVDSQVLMTLYMILGSILV